MIFRCKWIILLIIEDSNFIKLKEDVKEMYEFGEFKGRKTIKLMRTPDDKYPFIFGRAKAKLIVENYEVIKKFAEEE